MRKLYIFLTIFCLNTFPIYAKEVYVGGDSIGIVCLYDGLYVTGTYSFKENDSLYTNNTIQADDLIIYVNNKRIFTIKEFNNILDQIHESTYIPITLIRDDKTIDTQIYIRVEENLKECGLYVKENTKGIGTITYIDKETNKYGALAHSISKNNNVYLQKGAIYEANITSIKKAITNTPGEKIGKINYEQIKGDIKYNTDVGIFGMYTAHTDTKQTIETATLDEIKIAPATIQTVIHDTIIETFTIEITKITSDNRIEFVVTDKNLLNECGGIIHGMSGSPIIQNGKLVGAVTHVLVNDPMKGYGIFIENMLEAAG